MRVSLEISVLNNRIYPWKEFIVLYKFLCKIVLPNSPISQREAKLYIVFPYKLEYSRWEFCVLSLIDRNNCVEIIQFSNWSDCCRLSSTILPTFI